MRTGIKRCWAHGMYETRACLKCSERDAEVARAKVGERPATMRVSSTKMDFVAHVDVKRPEPVPVKLTATVTYGSRSHMQYTGIVSGFLAFFARLHEP